jgi:hypothetical protein
MPNTRQAGLTSRQVQNFSDDGFVGIDNGEFDPKLPPSPVPIAIRHAWVHIQIE